MNPLRIERAAARTIVIFLAIEATASPAAAHAFGSSRTPAWGIAVVLGGLVSSLAGIGLSARGRRKLGLGAFAAGAALLSVAMTGFSLDTGSWTSPAQVKIVEPMWGSKVNSPVKLRVNLVNGTLVPLDRSSGPPTEGHLHVYANGRAVGMFVDLEEDLQLPPGRYVLQVEFVGADHHSFSPPVADTVEIEVLPNKAQDET